MGSVPFVNCVCWKSSRLGLTICVKGFLPANRGMYGGV
jgi:hypothetical protein